MKTIQMTIDETLLDKVDKMTATLQMSRSAFIRLALEEALQQYRVKLLEERDAKGYEVLPAKEFENSEWLDEQHWGEGWNEAK